MTEGDGLLRWLRGLCFFVGGVLELLEKTTLGDGHTNGRCTDGFTRGASVNKRVEEDLIVDRREWIKMEKK